MGAVAFNQDIGQWDVSKVDDMQEMFRDAEAFNQNLSTWKLADDNRKEDMFMGKSIIHERFKPVDANTRRERERYRTTLGLVMTRATDISGNKLPPDIRKIITSYIGGKCKYTRRKNGKRSRTTCKKKRKKRKSRNP